MTTEARDLYFTAYASDQHGGWTVWDHRKDEAVAVGIAEADAVRIADDHQAQAVAELDQGDDQ
jgi:hypothetical protein